MRQLKIIQRTTFRTVSLDKFFQDISNYKVLSIQEEIDLFNKFKLGDLKAKDKIINANLKFVVSVAKQYQQTELDLQDLIDEGCIGLIKAVELFDTTRGFKFISYAVWWIRQAILNYLAMNGRFIRLPLNKIGTLKKIKDAKMAFEQKEGRDPTEEELAEILMIYEGDIRLLLSSSSRHTSLDSPVLGEDENRTEVDMLGSEDQNQFFKTDATIILEQIASQLRPREKLVMSMWYGVLGYEQHTPYEIGKYIQISEQQTRNIHVAIIRKLKKSKAVKKLLVGLELF